MMRQLLDHLRLVADLGSYLSDNELDYRDWSFDNVDYLQMPQANKAIGLVAAPANAALSSWSPSQ
jgi:hypothetical protein